MTSTHRPVVAVLGGTGRLGPGLARYFAAAGYPVVIGSRDAGRAAAAAQAISQTAPAGQLTGASNAEAARACGIAVVTVPIDGVAGTLADLRDELAGKIVVSTVVPLTFVDKAPTHVEVDGGSAARLIAGILPDSAVTSAFHTVSSADLDTLESLDSDTLVYGDDPAAIAATMELVRTVPGLRPVDSGGLRLSRYAEQLTIVLLGINRRHRARTGIRVTHLALPE